MPKNAHDYSSDSRVVCQSCRARLAPAESLRCPFCGAKQPTQLLKESSEASEAGYVYEHSANSRS